MNSFGTRRDPGGFIGLIILLIALAVALVFNIEWLLFCSGGGVVVWLLMAIFGFMMGARR